MGGTSRALSAKRFWREQIWVGRNRALRCPEPSSKDNGSPEIHSFWLSINRSKAELDQQWCVPHACARLFSPNDPAPHQTAHPRSSDAQLQSAVSSRLLQPRCPSILPQHREVRAREKSSVATAADLKFSSPLAVHTPVAGTLPGNSPRPAAKPIYSEYGLTSHDGQVTMPRQ